MISHFFSLERGQGEQLRGVGGERGGRQTLEEMPKEMQKEEGVGTLLNKKHNQFQPNIVTYNQMQPRPSQLAELSRSEYDTEFIFS